MNIKRYVQIAIFVIIINLVSVFNIILIPWSIVYLIFAVFIVNNRDSDKILRDKKIYSFIQAFMIIVFTFIFTVFSMTIYPIMYYLVQTYFAGFFYVLLIIAIIGLISFYYLFIKLLREAIKVLRQEEAS